MKKRIQFIITAALFVCGMAFSLNGWGQLGKIHGKVVQDGKPVIGAKVSLWQDGNFAGKGMETGEDGKYEFAMLNPGEYTVKVTQLGNETALTVSVFPGESQPLAIQLVASAETDNDSSYVIPTVDIFDKIIFDVDRNVIACGRDYLKTVAGPRDIISIIASTGAPIFQKDHGDPMNFKGARDNANATYFDNMKLRGEDDMPLGAIEQITVMTGGVPAEYGDVLGAVIVVTTRNPSMYMGHVGKPLTKAERQLLKQQRKRGTDQSRVEQSGDLACR